MCVGGGSHSGGGDDGNSNFISTKVTTKEVADLDEIKSLNSSSIKLSN
jgi:hypothetical protein